MRTKLICLSFGLCLIVPSVQALDTAQAFESALAGPRCFTRTYTKAEVSSHLKQTVSSITAQVRYWKSKNTREVGTPILDIAVRFKDEPRGIYGQSMSCINSKDDTTGKNRVLCYVDCDGGSVDIAEIDSDKITLKNNGVLVRGGCGSNKKMRNLESVPGGDDIFVLHNTRLNACRGIEKLGN